MSLKPLFDDIADAIRSKKGITGLIKAADFASEIESIPTGEWQPHPDWWDIEELVKLSSELDPSTRYGFVVTDSNNTIILPVGYEYRLSDESYYNLVNSSEAVIHTWDRTKDRLCSDGYKTRAVIVHNSANRNVVVDHRSIDSIYVYFGNCSITSLSFGAAADPRNYKIQAVKMSNDTNISTITASAFRYCFSLISIDIPRGTTTIDNSSFQFCYALKNVVLPEGLKSIANNAFYGCYSMTSIVIPESVTSVAANIFSNCLSLVNVTVPKDFNFTISLSGSSCMSVSSLENIIRNYADRTGLSTLTLTLGETNLAKLSDDIIALAISKNITLA